MRTGGHANWYFKDYEKRTVLENGRKKVVWDYNGDYYSYGFDKHGLGIFKLKNALLLLLYIAVYVAVSVYPFGANRTAYVGAVHLLALVPMFFLIMGVGNLLFTDVKMTYREHHASVFRIDRSLTVSLILEGLVAVLDVVYLIIGVEPSDLKKELLFLVGVLVGFAALAVIRLMQKKHPCKVIPGKQRNA